MMKKLIAFLLFFALAAAMLCGCGWNKSTAQTEVADGTMMVVYNDGYTIIYVDTRTGVQYFTRGTGGMCIMENADGSNMLFPGFDAMEDRPNG